MINLDVCMLNYDLFNFGSNLKKIYNTLNHLFYFKLDWICVLTMFVWRFRG